MKNTKDMSLTELLIELDTANRRLADIQSGKCDAEFSAKAKDLKFHINQAELHRQIEEIVNTYF